MRLDPEILDGPPEPGARILALATLADAEDALARLVDPADREALPAFRSALRRLVGALGAAAPALSGAVPQERRVRLEAALRRGESFGEADGLAAWLEGIRAVLPAPYRGALDWLVDRVERRRQAGGERAAREAERRFRRIAERLRDELTARRAPPPRQAAGAGFAPTIAAALRARTRALRDAVMAVAGGEDAPALGRVRDEATRLGDLLEPLRGSVPGAGDALDALRPLRDAVEQWHGASRAELALEAALLEARAEEVRRGEAAIGGVRPGLLAVLRLAQERAADAYARLASQHLVTRASAATDASYAVVAALEGRGAGEAGTEPAAPERRFLVTGIPPEGRGGDTEELEQGWLPGDGRESVGVTRSRLGEQWFRSRAAGRGGAVRVGSIARAEFEAFWPLTAGRRVAKRRHAVAGAPGWRFDEYLDRPLVVAVAEGNAEEPPSWLEPVLVRDVSGERGYLDEALARRPPRRTG